VVGQCGLWRSASPDAYQKATGSIREPNQLVGIDSLTSDNRGLQLFCPDCDRGRLLHEGALCLSQPFYSAQVAREALDQVAETARAWGAAVNSFEQSRSIGDPTTVRERASNAI
jgi:molybdenum cofactor biosynthesis enzyme MoaA